MPGIIKPRKLGFDKVLVLSPGFARPQRFYDCGLDLSVRRQVSSACQQRFGPGARIIAHLKAGACLPGAGFAVNFESECFEENAEPGSLVPDSNCLVQADPIGVEGGVQQFLNAGGEISIECRCLIRKQQAQFCFVDLHSQFVQFICEY